jgi:S1-C subfamily serine protease
MSQIDDPRTVADAPDDGVTVGDPAQLASLPPPPVVAPTPPPLRGPGRVTVAATRLSAGAAGLAAGPRRGSRARARMSGAAARLSAGAAGLAAGPRRGRVWEAAARLSAGVVGLAAGRRRGQGAPAAVERPPGRTARVAVPPLPPPDLTDWSVSGERTAGTSVDGLDVSVEPAPPAPPVEPDADPDLDVGPDPAVVPAPGLLRSRHQRRKEWRRVERARRYAARKSVRFPIFTRSILLWMLIFALMGTSAGGTAAVFWTHFNTQIAELREETEDFDKRSQVAEARIEMLRNQAVEDLDNRMKDLAPALAEPRTLQAAKLLSPYVWFVSTLDENGVPSVGTAYSVATDDRSTLLVTSYNVVRAGSVRPAPPIKLRKDPDEIGAELVNWDSGNDLALLRIDRPNQPVLEWAPEDAQAKLVGTRLYVVTGFGGAGATLNSAMTIDQNAKGLMHDGRIGTAAQGGPMVTTDGKVVAVASLVYQPLGFDPGELHYAVPVRKACDVLLTCTVQARRARIPTR